MRGTSVDTSPLPDDLAHPRGERLHLVANVGVGIALAAIAGAVLVFALAAFTS